VQPPQTLVHHTHEPQAKVYPLGALTADLKGQALTEMVRLSQTGCVAFSQGNTPVQDTAVLLRAMQYAKSFDLAVWLRPQDAWLSRGGVVANGAYASRLGLAAIPVEAETIALQTLLSLQRLTEVRMHLCRLSSAEAINMVRAAKKEGLPITCDVAANQVHLTDIDIGYYDRHFRLDPPLRGQRDRDAIQRGLLDGTIDAVCSDHTPLTDLDKSLSFAEAVPGAMGLELLLSLTLKWAQEARVPLRDALKLVTHAPGQVLGQSAGWSAFPGSLTVGAPADVCVVDPEQYWLVCRENIVSVSQCTPFLGRELPGRVVATVLRGDLVWERSR
jgi:dihydroorotase